MDHLQRTAIAIEISKTAGAMALDFFRARDSLHIDHKGQQDFVTKADREVELHIRAALTNALPNDAIVGEEHAPTPGTSGFTWVIDPIDGTANFVSGVPFWCVAIAGVFENQTQVGVIYDPVHDELFVATRGHGFSINGKMFTLPKDNKITEGTVAMGSSRRAKPAQVAHLIEQILDRGGVFARMGSGALGLTYVAAGRYLAYTESFMNAWDCLAAQLMIVEAGGQSEHIDPNAFIPTGGRVISGAPGIYDDILDISNKAFTEDT